MNAATRAHVLVAVGVGVILVGGLAGSGAMTIAHTPSAPSLPPVATTPVGTFVMRPMPTMTTVDASAVAAVYDATLQREAPAPASPTAASTPSSPPSAPTGSPTALATSPAPVTEPTSTAQPVPPVVKPGPVSPVDTGQPVTTTTTPPTTSTTQPPAPTTTPTTEPPVTTATTVPPPTGTCTITELTINISDDQMVVEMALFSSADNAPFTLIMQANGVSAPSSDHEQTTRYGNDRFQALTPLAVVSAMTTGGELDVTAQFQAFSCTASTRT